MTNVRKKISELTALTSASLDTVIVGVDNGTTYKIELDVLADAVTNRINTLDIQRLNSLESVTSSFETKGRSLISSSAQITNLGFISTSVDISSLNTFTSSQQTLNTALTNGISSRLTTSSFESFSSSVHSEILAATNEQSFNGLISGSSQLTSSYDERYVLSGSITQTTWDNIANKPAGIVSQSTDLTSLNSKTGSYATTGSNTFIGNQRITGSVSILIPGGTAYAINENPSANNEFWAYVVEYPNAQNVAVGWTAAIVGGGTYTVTAVNYQHPFNKITLSDGSLTMGYRIGINFSKSSKLWEFNSNGTLTGLPDGLISGSSQLTSSFDSRYLVTGSITSSINQLNTFTASVSTASLVNRLNAIESVSGSWITESETGSFLINLSGAISSSNQLTESFDTRYTLSGSVQPLPNGLVSSSIQVLGGSGVISSSAQIDTLFNIDGLVSGSSQLTSSYDSRYSLSGSVLTSFSSSVDNRLDTLEATIISGSINYTQVLGNRRTNITTTGISIISGSITTSGNPVQVMVTGDANPTSTGWTRLQLYRGESTIGNIIQVENEANQNVPYCLNIIDTPSTGTHTYSMRIVSGISGVFDFGEADGPLLTIAELKSNTQLPSGLISGSSQLTSSYDTRYTLSGSVQPLPNGIISGSSQLTASYDTRYTLSGSVVSGTTPSGTISGSAQISAFGFVSGSYVTTSSFNSFTASAQSVTTGSNSFNGTQIITGSLIITTGSFIGSQILANTSSLYLTSGSNLYVQNNGLVEITGSLVVSGSVNIVTTSPLQIGTGSGDEGGEILLAKSATNSTLTGTGITIDSYRDILRIFEQGGDARGVYIDLAKTPTGVSGELIWKASGMVNAGTFVTLDNIKATVTSSGNRGLSIAAVSTNFTANISAYYAMNGGMAGTATNNFSVTTTPTSTLFTWNFTTEGDGAYYTIVDKTNNRMYRVTLMIGASYNNNFISIERLY
jgi:hypothetical protein